MYQVFSGGGGIHYWKTT